MYLNQLSKPSTSRMSPTPAHLHLSGWSLVLSSAPKTYSAAPRQAVLYVGQRYILLTLIGLLTLYERTIIIGISV